MLRALLLLVFCSLYAFNGTAQLGGLHTFEFLNLSPSARITALGGNLITVRDDDAGLAFGNPASLNAQVHQAIAFNHNFHVAGINNGYVSYGHHFDKWDLSSHVGIQYVSYGDFDQTDVLGQNIGSFKAAEYAFTFGAAKVVYDRLSIGANVKVISSQLESYNSFGIASDLSAMYFDTSGRFAASVVFRNIGVQLSTFTEDNNEPLPFEIQLGLSRKLRYLPFRFSIIYRYFNRWNVLYDDPNATEDASNLFFGEAPTERSSTSIWFDNFFRHFIFNGEFLIGAQENFRLRFGYNHLMRQELGVEGFGSLAGFTFGAGIKINRFRIDYGRSNFHLGGGLNHFSISTNIQEFR